MVSGAGEAPTKRRLPLSLLLDFPTYPVFCPPRLRLRLSSSLEHRLLSVYG